MKSNRFWILSFGLFLLCTPQVLQAQQTWVYLRDKCNSGEDYFNTPICPDYLAALQAEGVEIMGSSRWLNAICINNAPTSLTELPFVRKIMPVGQYKVTQEAVHTEFGYGQGDWQINMLRIDSFHRKGYTGKGVKIALFDAGFYKVDSFPAFDSLWDQGRIIASRDFIRKDSLSFRESTHGMQVLSLTGAHYPDSLIGACPGATFLLARTEDADVEKHSEEYSWIQAMEWADSIGVDIIHSSLGYSLFDSLEGDYSYADMDGKSTIITLAAELAASRGIFISNSAGNSGDEAWHYITAPCDGEHVLCTGAVDSFRQKADFSSFGPTADGRIKPDIVAMGTRNTILNENGLLHRGSGTSFSAPIVAGMVACLMEAHPGRSNAAIFEAILRSADRFENPDSAYGHGIPDILKADSILQSMLAVEYALQKPKKELKLYPNPAHNEIRLYCHPGSVYHLLDGQGRTLSTDALPNWLNFIDLRDLSPGMYYILVDGEGKRERAAFVKQ